MAPERPRRQPQVFPKSHFPQRRFAYFAAVGKVGRRRSGETSVAFRGYFACGRVTFYADRKSPKSRQRGEGFRIVPTPFVSLRSTFPPDRGNRPPAILWFLSDRSERNSPPQRRNLCFVLGGCSACGRATFQRRKVTASSQSPLCSGHPGLGIPHAAPLLLLSNHEPLRWVHGWGPIAGLRARTQESCAVSLALAAGAVPS